MILTSQIASEFLKLAAIGNVREAYSRFVGKNFIHHNPYFEGDADSLMKGMEESASLFPNKVLEIKKTFGEGEYVTVLSCVKLQPEDIGIALVHIFKFEKNLIVELWDINQQIPENSPNIHGMF